MFLLICHSMVKHSEAVISLFLNCEVTASYQFQAENSGHEYEVR
jgi:hypothetical protein